MSALELYAKVEHLLGIEEATEALCDLYASELKDHAPKTLLDIGCGRGVFMKRMTKEGVICKGIDLSEIMVRECIAKGLDVNCADIYSIAGSFDAITAIFDVVNFVSPDELHAFLDAVASRLSDDGIFIADINTLYGFRDVAQGCMSSEDEKGFLTVDAVFEDEKLYTKFTFFEKETQKYDKYQETILQYFHKLRDFERSKSLKLVDKQTFSLYDTKDKTLLVFKKRAC